MKNIEAVEEAKRDYMKKLSQSSSNDSSSSLNTLKKGIIDITLSIWTEIHYLNIYTYTSDNYIINIYECSV